MYLLSGCFTNLRIQVLATYFGGLFDTGLCPRVVFWQTHSIMYWMLKGYALTMTILPQSNQGIWKKFNKFDLLISRISQVHKTFKEDEMQHTSKAKTGLIKKIA